MKKRFFAKHAKSSAALVSVAIHAALIVVAVSFVAVSVIVKEDQSFEVKPVKRPKMQLKKLQVPVNVKKKKTQKPKLRKRILVKPRLNQNMPDIKMPEITGVKGGMGNAAGDGLGGSGGVGFDMPEFELFGVKGKGEKIFIALDSTEFMMVDEIGGIPAYTLIKSELIRILEGLNPTVLFNVAVYDNQHVARFPTLVPASADNVAKVEEWLDSLNAVKTGMSARDYGTRTLGKGGTVLRDDLSMKPLQSNPGEWARAGMMAMRQQADVVFILSCRWGHIVYKVDDAEAWGEEKLKRWRRAVANARVKFNEENKKRRAKGEAPRVIAHGDRGLVRAYYPNEPQPPHNKYYHYTPKEMNEAFKNIRDKWRPRQVARKSGVRSRKKKDRFTFNIIYFSKVGEPVNPSDKERFGKLASLTRGDFQSIQGMEAIQGYVPAGELAPEAESGQGRGAAR